MGSPKLPFVDFYSSHGIIPTRQDISDFTRHFERRLALYRHLGIPPVALRGVSVLEFGPGSGHNAVVTGLLEPRRYLLVDGNTPSLDSTRQLLQERCPQLSFELKQSSIMQFKTEEKFDVVLCEAVIPTQKDPSAFFRHVARFARPGGIFVFTCMDSISLLPEMLRRWLAWRIVKDIEKFEDRVAHLTKFFESDLDALPGMSRRREDWVTDQLLHPWAGPLFSIPEAIEALGDRGAILGSSPRFLIDWRWYKTMVSFEGLDNSFAIESYYTAGLNLIDFRVRLAACDQKGVRQIADLSQKVCDAIFAQERGEATFTPAAMRRLLTRIERILRRHSPKTADACASFIDYLESGMARVNLLSRFRPWWGRGQQYVSCIMR